MLAKFACTSVRPSIQNTVCGRRYVAIRCLDCCTFSMVMLLFCQVFFSSKKRLEVHNRAITKLGKQENEVCLQSTLCFDVEAKPKWHLLSTTIITKTLQEVVDIYAWLPLTLQMGLKYLRGKTARKPEYERLDRPESRKCTNCSRMGQKEICKRKKCLFNFMHDCLKFYLKYNIQYFNIVRLQMEMFVYSSNVLCMSTNMSKSSSCMSLI